MAFDVPGRRSHSQGRVVVVDPPTVLAPAEADVTPQVEMCCDGSGRTVEQHRAESTDHRCCVDK